MGRAQTGFQVGRIGETNFVVVVEKKLNFSSRAVVLKFDNILKFRHPGLLIFVHFPLEALHLSAGLERLI